MRLLALTLAAVAVAAPTFAADCVPSRADASKIERLDAAWREALANARRDHRADVRKLGALANPKAGLKGRPQPSPGLYRCRTIKLGSQGAALSYVAYPYFRCRVELTAGGDLRLAKISGSQRQVGDVCPVPGRLGDRRTLFLGGLGLGADRAPAYGASRNTDAAGVIERIGPNRWRMVTPWPAYESKLDILELLR
ncbi:DUF4893 domain-containing protein [Phenylobacterium immobile]|uniref:DUF4893 domain-containing protein n=1 Tax=Phenylobacterium immobile TaxID=21 RepID=UPI000A7E451B|nr:DUF4893 domain-containing protein [Phenylobacterium immobile]